MIIIRNFSICVAESTDDGGSQALISNVENVLLNFQLSREFFSFRRWNSSKRVHSPFSKFICCSCWIEFSSTTFNSSWMLRRRISVEGNAMGGGLGKSRWLKFNFAFKFGGDEGDRECIELSESSISEASSGWSTCSTSVDSSQPPPCCDSGVFDLSRLFFDRLSTERSSTVVGVALRELRCFSFSTLAWCSSSFSFLNLCETTQQRERER